MKWDICYSDASERIWTCECMLECNCIQRKQFQQGVKLLKDSLSFLRYDSHILEQHDSNSRIKEYIEKSEQEGLIGKNWNFPKNHLYVHLFDDIVAKGVTRNYSTKPNEQMHGPLRKIYQRTNFRDIAPQVLSLMCCLV